MHVRDTMPHPRLRRHLQIQTGKKVVVAVDYIVTF